MRILQIHAAMALTGSLFTCALTTGAAGQATSPTLYYTGHTTGDIEVLSVHADGMELINEVPSPATAMKVSPNGTHLAVVRAGDVIEIRHIQSNGNVEHVTDFDISGSPVLAMEWVSDSIIAVLTNAEPKVLRTYVFDAVDKALEPADEQETSFPWGWNGDLAVRSQHDVVYVGSADPWIESHLVDEQGGLTPGSTVELPSVNASDMAVNRSGATLYAVTSTGGSKDVFAYHVNETGAFAPVDGQPFQTLNDSLNRLAFAETSSGSETLLVNNVAGEISTMFVQDDGTLTTTGHLFEPDTTFIPWSFVLVADGNMAFNYVWTHGPDKEGATGVFSFVVEDDGSLSSLAPVYESEPFTLDTQLAFTFPAPSPGDLNGDGVVDGADLLILLSAWGECADHDDCPADLNGDGIVDGADLLILLSNWG